MGPKAHYSYVRLSIILRCSVLSASESDQETHFDQPDCVWILSFKIILSDFKSFIKVVVLYMYDEFGFLNRLMLISKAQDISVWISSVKVENLVVRRILTWVCRSNSRSKWHWIFSHNTFLASLTCVLQLILSSPSHSRTLTWQKNTYHDKLSPKHKMQNFLSFNN